MSSHSCLNDRCSPQLFRSLVLCFPSSTFAPQQPVLHLAVRYILENRKQNRSVLCRSGSSPFSLLPIPVLESEAFLFLSMLTSFLPHSTFLCYGLSLESTVSQDFSHSAFSLSFCLNLHTLTKKPFLTPQPLFRSYAIIYAREFSTYQFTPLPRGQGMYCNTKHWQNGHIRCQPQRPGTHSNKYGNWKRSSICWFF